jgi:hypothetical protein
MTDEKNGYYCYLCDYRTTKNSDWIKHQTTKKHLRNGQPKTTICNICNFSTSTHWNLKLHILSHHSTKEERQKHKYYCEVCDLVFFCSTYMEKHQSGKIHKNKQLCSQYQKELDEKQKLETLST